TPKSRHSESGLLDDFDGRLVPRIEERTGPPRRRLVFGESMGGLNAVMVALFKPSFATRVAALCPPIYKASPFDSWSDWWAFLKRTGADPRIVFGVVGVARTYLDSPEQWRAIDPLSVLAKTAGTALPELYVSNGLYDRYGNFEGVEAFVRSAREKGARVEWRPLYGGHCATDIASLAGFLARD
ncbi:MAG TPA: alpha/beta hydrolase-fold protein, partial [Bdellovibrionales bacterium]|nr:alpha/beta hydrolase-fold protein [Bdellovibrionales bacterium]